MEALETEVTRLRERRLRRCEEQLYAERHHVIEQVYRNLENKQKRSDWPMQLCIFRQLPIVKSFQDKMGMTKEQLMKELEEDGVKKLWRMNIGAWKEQTEKKFSSMLKISKQRFVDPEKVKIIERATARYLCTKCSPPGCERQKHAPIGLSFVEACRHRCPNLDKRQRKRATWRPEQFVADQKVQFTRFVVTWH